MIFKTITTGTNDMKMEQLARKWNNWQKNGTDGNDIERLSAAYYLILRAVVSDEKSTHKTTAISS